MMLRSAILLMCSLAILVGRASGADPAVSEAARSFYGQDGPVDLPRAERLYRAAVARGESTGVCDCWYWGLGFPQDEQKALDCFKNEEPAWAAYLILNKKGKTGGREAALDYLEGASKKGGAASKAAGGLIKDVKAGRKFNELGPDPCEGCMEGSSADVRRGFILLYQQDSLLNARIGAHVKRLLGKKGKAYDDYAKRWRKIARKFAKKYVEGYKGGSLQATCFDSVMADYEVANRRLLTALYNVAVGSFYEKGNILRTLERSDALLKEIAEECRMYDDSVPGLHFKKDLGELQKAWGEWEDAAYQLFLKMSKTDDEELQGRFFQTAFKKVWISQMAKYYENLKTKERQYFE